MEEARRLPGLLAFWVGVGALVPVALAFRGAWVFFAAAGFAALV